MNLVRDIEHYKRLQGIANGSVIVYSYQKRGVDLIESAREVESKSADGPVKRWVFTSMGNWLDGTNGVVLARLIDGNWFDRPVSIETVEKLLEQGKVKK